MIRTLALLTFWLPLVTLGCAPSGSYPPAPQAPAPPPVPTVGSSIPTSQPAPTAPAPQGLSQQELEGRHRESINRLKALGMALHQYHDTLGSLPPAYVADAEGKPLYSWRVLLLPFVGQSALHDQFDRSKAWDAPENLAISNTVVEAYKSPADPGIAANGCSYAAVVGAPTAFPGAKPIKLFDAQDGTSNTVALVEVRGLPGSWAAPVELRFDDLKYELGAGAGQFNSPYPQGVQVLLLDGAVMFIRQPDIPGWMRGAITRAGNDYVDFQ